MPRINSVNYSSGGLTSRPFRFFGFSGINSPSNLFGPGFDVFSQYSDSPVGYFGTGVGPANYDYWSYATGSPFTSNYLRSVGLFRGGSGFNNYNNPFSMINNLFSSFFNGPFSFFWGNYSNYVPYTGPTILDNIFSSGYSTSDNLSRWLGNYGRGGSDVNRPVSRRNTYRGGVNYFTPFSFRSRTSMVDDIYNFTGNVMNIINSALLTPSPVQMFDYDTDFAAFQMLSRMPITIKIEFNPPTSVTRA